MSRHILKTTDPTLTATIGWDPPLQTFFAQVERNGDDPDDDPETILWEGLRPGQHPSPDTLVAMLAPYATVPATTIAALLNDKATSTQPSLLQRRMANLI